MRRNGTGLFVSMVRGLVDNQQRDGGQVFVWRGPAASLERAIADHEVEPVRGTLLKPPKCGACGARFLTARALDSHIAFRHGVEAEGPVLTP